MIDIRTKMIGPSALGLVLCLIGSGAVRAESSPDGVEVAPLYLSDEGSGILRYEDPASGGDEYTAAWGGLSEDTVRPFEVMGALGGPWSGPRVAICIEYMQKNRMMNGRLAFELYNLNQKKPVMRFRPVFDAERAEAITQEGEGAGPGECSRKYAR